MSYYGPNKHDYRSLIGWLVLTVVLLVILTLVGFGLGWIEAPLRVMSPQNMEQLSQEANDSWQALESQLESIQTLERKARDMELSYGEDRTKWPLGKRDEYLQLQQQIANSITAYNNACGQYKAMWSDEWRSYPAPDDLPTSCDLYTQK